MLRNDIDADALEKYDAQISNLAMRYTARVLEILNHLRDSLVEVGFECTPAEELWSDIYIWNFQVIGSSGVSTVDVSVVLAEELAFGTGMGVNWSLNIVELPGGKILGGMTPLQYDMNCWMDPARDTDVMLRLGWIEGVDSQDVVALVKKERRPDRDTKIIVEMTRAEIEAACVGLSIAMGESLLGDETREGGPVNDAAKPLRDRLRSLIS